MCPDFETVLLSRLLRQGNRVHLDRRGIAQKRGLDFEIDFEAVVSTLRYKRAHEVKGVMSSMGGDEMRGVMSSRGGDEMRD